MNHIQDLAIFLARCSKGESPTGRDYEYTEEDIKFDQEDGRAYVPTQDEDGISSRLYLPVDLQEYAKSLN